MTTTETEVPVMTEAPATIELRVADRCDGPRCGAQAFVIVAKRDLTLFLCAHDYRKHELALVADGWLIAVDHRPKINAKPSPSANAV